MPTILVVTGSVRPNSVNQKIVPVVVEELEKQGATARIADLKELNLPFFDDENAPASPEFAPTHESVKVWTALVAEADGVVFVTPEYNHMLSPVQTNAIDWVGKEWSQKPVAFVGYGWGGAQQAHAVARGAMGQELQAKLVDTQTNLFFTKDINPDGTLIDESAVRSNIATTVADLLS
jgi:NAD(P)H-dependent FMN reductase